MIFSRFSGTSPIDLDKPWGEVDYVAIDLETTGLNLKSDEIISYGTIQIHNSRIENSTSSYRIIRPSRHPSETSIKIHGIRRVDVAEAESITMVAPEIISQLKDHLIIAHAAWIERAFLTEPLRKAGFRFPKQVIDTAALAKACGLAGQAEGHEPSLEFLARTLDLPVYSPHNALGDAMTTCVVFLALVHRLERSHKQDKHRSLTLRELLKISAAK